MTVGVASITNAGSNGPIVLLGADRLLTTRQQSAIEHEHSESKLAILGSQLTAANIQVVLSGAMSLGEELKTRITHRVGKEIQKQDASAIGVQHVAQWSAEEYRKLVQNKVENLVLSSYGLELADLSRQHQFKDGFFDGVIAEVENLEQQINSNLSMLLGGVDLTGAYIYGISGNDHTSYVNPGYATIGSGTQPAESEFIKAEYAKSCSTEEGLSICASALYEAQQASGVGGTIDIGVVGTNVNRELDRGVVDQLMDREETIAEEQESLRAQHIQDNPVNIGDL